MDVPEQAYPATETNTSVAAGQRATASDLDAILRRRICYYPELTAVLRLPEAVFFSQLWWWTRSSGRSDGDGWVEASQEEWQRVTGLRRRAWITARQGLLDQGLVEESDRGGRQALLYRVNIQAVVALYARAVGGDPRAQDALSYAREPRDGMRANRATVSARTARINDRHKERSKESKKPRAAIASSDGSPVRGSQLSDSWEPNEELVTWAREHFPTVEVVLETDAFRDHAKSKGRVAKDWNAAWRNWIRKAAQFQKNAPATATAAGPQYRPASEVLLEADGP